MNQLVRFRVNNLFQPTRLDRLLRDRFPQWGRQAVQQLISAKQVRINDKTVWLASWKVNNGDHIEVRMVPDPKPLPPQHFAEQWLLAQDADLVVVNKPAGLLSESPSMRDAANLRDLAAVRFGDVILFDRLDRNACGVVLLTRPGPINQSLARAFQEGLVRKCYCAIVALPNALQPAGTISARLDQHPRRRDMMTVVDRGGKHAVTDYRVLAEDPATGRQLILLYPQTGRTHQLRVHLAHLGTPILGDRLYGDASSADRLLLHAYQLDLPPLDGKPARRYTAPLPAEFGHWVMEEETM